MGLKGDEEEEEEEDALPPAPRGTGVRAQLRAEGAGGGRSGETSAV